MVKKVVTRFNPSPTGYLHVGNARTALFAWLWARHNDGTFLLRIEDTDRARFVADAEDQIKESLAWLGLDWEGAVIRQSEQRDLYHQHATQLIEAGKAYESKEEAGTVIRFKWPDDPGELTVTYFDDGKRQDTRLFSQTDTPSAFEEFVLIKSDGLPTYNFAHIIDDHAQGVTDVIRGDEFIPSLNKYVALYQAFGWSPPRYVHVSQILGSDKSKLSKRHGATDILEYRAAGFLPSALANFIALIGWSPGGDRELFFTLNELADAFDLTGLQKSPGVFDENKLRWMNKEHMKNLDTGELLTLAKAGGFWKDGEAAAFELAAERAATMAELKLDDFYTSRPKLTKQQLVGKENSESVAVWLEKTQRYLEGLEAWESDRLQTSLTDVRAELDLAPKQLFPVLREALTGAPKTPSIWEIMAVLGKPETLARLEAAAALVS